VGQQKICTVLHYSLHITLQFPHYTTVSRVWVNLQVHMGVACTGTDIGFPDLCQHRHRLPVTTGSAIHSTSHFHLHRLEPGISSMPSMHPLPLHMPSSQCCLKPTVLSLPSSTHPLGKSPLSPLPRCHSSSPTMHHLKPGILSHLSLHPLEHT